MAKSQVTTFYSYKGGSGRSMALANVAWALATNDEKVLAIDWDLEAPGLHRYFHPFLSDPDQSTSKGLIDRVWDYVEQLGEDPSVQNRFNLADCNDIVQRLEMPEIGKGCLHFIGAGRQDEHYSQKVGGLDWNGFYQRFDGESFINALMEWARGRYTHVLIDSRTGVADTAGICTTQVPDALVLCLVYNRQSIEGTAAIARSIKGNRRKFRGASLKMSFVPCRVEERSAVEAARRHTAQKLVGLVDRDLTKIEQSLRRAEIRNYPWCAFEEKLAVFEELPDERGSLLDLMHDLARRISGTDNLRIKTLDPDVLTSYWRRAAFDDPRLYDLQAIAEQSTSDGWTQLDFWLQDALDRGDERPDWLISLAETAMGFVSRRDGRLPQWTAQTFAESSVRLAREAYHADPRTYRERLSLVLEDMAVFLQRGGKPSAALDYIDEAEGLWRHERSPASRLRLARTLEKRADILDALGDEGATIEVYHQIASIYRLIERQSLPVGNELDPARIQRMLALKLFKHGDLDAARNVIMTATQLLDRTSPTGRDRDAAEIVNILTMQLRIAARTDIDNFEGISQEVLATANRFLQSEKARDAIREEIFSAEVEVLLRQGLLEEALVRLDYLQANTRHLARYALLKSRVLMEMGRYGEASDRLVAGIKHGAIPLTGDVIEQLRRAFNATGQGERIYDVLMSGLQTGGEHAASLLPLLERVFKKARQDTKGEVSADDLAEYSALLSKTD